MGVINVTPDSFSDGGKFDDPELAANQARRLVEQGADILDIGGESTRPFSEPVSVDEELNRVIPAIRSIREVTDTPISIDTTKAHVAARALEAGADIINDVSGLRFDPEMADVAVSNGGPVVIMHMRGSPRDMQVSPHYDDVVEEVRSFLAERLEWAVGRGIPEKHLIIDPGIGFGKTFEDNLKLIKHLDKIASLGVPVLLGASRKAFLGAITGLENPEERDVATLGAVAYGVIKGAHIVRVHNVGLTMDVLKVVDAIDREAISCLE